MSTSNNTPTSPDEVRDLMRKPVWQMSGEELCILAKFAASTTTPQIGKRIVFDAERARELADDYQKPQRVQRETQ